MCMCCLTPLQSTHSWCFLPGSLVLIYMRRWAHGTRCAFSKRRDGLTQYVAVVAHTYIYGMCDRFDNIRGLILKKRRVPRHRTTRAGPIMHRTGRYYCIMRHATCVHCLWPRRRRRRRHTSRPTSSIGSIIILIN